MKRHKNLYSKITTFQNLLLAAKKAQARKRSQPSVANFNFHLEKRLFQIQKELKEQSYQPQAYKEFYILEPKPRMISAAPYEDRVVHHALCNIVAPILENSMIYDTYANREGKGTHKAILRYQAFSKNNEYALKCDVRKFFPSIDHEILKQEIRKKIGCSKTLWLIDKIIDNSNPQEEHLVYFPQDDLFSPHQRKLGLPIGNLTSQLLGNYYLNAFDHFVKEQLQCKYYLRYVDDFVILEDDKQQLLNIKSKIAGFLANYRLILHPNKSRVYPTKDGLTFLGHRVFPAFRLLKSENIRRFRKRTRRNIKAFHKGEINRLEFYQRTQAWFAHAAFSNTERLRKKIIYEIYGK
ncbi:MAG: RNA-directed DNA polymerase [Bacteroidota bacterium]